MPHISPEVFTTTITERSTGVQPHADTATESLTVGTSRVAVRLQGGYITAAVLTDAQGQAVPVLYADPDTSRTKLNASHTMIPAGPSEGLGGQHGFPRWADYDVTTRENSLTLRARTPQDGLQLEKELRLETSELTLITRLTNRGSETVHTSIGEHLYFALPDEQAEGLRIGTEPPLQPLPNMAGIMQGESLFWEAFQDHMIADFPDGKAISLHSMTTMHDDSGTHRPAEAPTGMLLWHRPGTPSICLEPVVGSDGLPNNQLLAVEAGCTAVMQTTIMVQ